MSVLVCRRIPTLVRCRLIGVPHTPTATFVTTPAVANIMADRNYIRYDSGVTKVGPGEADNIAAIKAIFNRVIHGDSKTHGHTYVTTHARTLGVVKGKLIVPKDLPKHLKQGLFARAGTYPVVMRYSFNNHDVSADAIKSRGRGITFKVFNVAGDRFPEGANNTTQDFTLNSQLTVSELADARTAQEIITLVEKGLTDPQGVVNEIVKRPDVALQVAPSRQPRRRVESMEFYSQFSYRFGDYVAKFGLFPATDAQTDLAKQELPPDRGNITDLINWIKEYYSTHEAVYDMKFQLLENLQEQPVEYAGTPWDTQKYPYQTVAKLVLPKQDSYIDELVKFWEDNMRITAWRGLKTLEPLGSSNRVRRELYTYSREIREKLNPSKWVDVQKIEDLPGPVPKL